jgi:glycine betaine/choline ABC-type transport system substrate-binding protein
MKYVNLILAVTALGVSTIAAANTGTITINGKIFNETCILSGVLAQMPLEQKM